MNWTEILWTIASIVFPTLIILWVIYIFYKKIEKKAREQEK